MSAGKTQEMVQAGGLVDQTGAIQAKNEAELSPLVRMAMSNDVDADKLEKLLDVQMRWEAEEARKAFNAAKSAFLAESPKIIKGSHVEFGNTKYDHATLGAALTQLSPILSKYGLDISWRTDQGDGVIKVAARLSHAAGHHEETMLSSAPDQSGGKNSIQAIGSAVTYLKRYTAFALLGLEAIDADDDGNLAGQAPVETITDEQLAGLRDTLESVGKSEAKFVDYLKAQGASINALGDLPAGQWYDFAVKTLSARAKA